MNIDLSSILLFLLAIVYLVMLPGYLVTLALRLRDLDIMEILTASFGAGISVLVILSIGLSLTGSIGLTLPSLAVADTTFVVIVGLIVYLKARSRRRADQKTGQSP